METILDLVNQGTHFNGDLVIFTYIGNIGPHYMATFSLIGFMIGLQV